MKNFYVAVIFLSFNPYASANTYEPEYLYQTGSGSAFVLTQDLILPANSSSLDITNEVIETNTKCWLNFDESTKTRKLEKGSSIEVLKTEDSIRNGSKVIFAGYSLAKSMLCLDYPFGFSDPGIGFVSFKDAKSTVGQTFEIFLSTPESVQVKNICSGKIQH